MPESKRRKKKSASSTGSAAAVSVPSAHHQTGNPSWFVPVVLGLMVVGLAWVVVFYLTSGKSDLPIPAIGRWNLAVGFGLMITGFGMLTRWK
ncbi:cell division protein CrgA [Luteimicrobium sp. DT211]|uniref:cell division protein CrgA n=1 Tax=Luteimicrobium sp. DT211 TaxID=3393412 RepID=UPI003CEF9F4B